jgi:D-alanine-D-alanine ligase
MTDSLLLQKKIAVLYGGDSAEREVSLNSGQAVVAGLQRAGVNAELIDTQDYDLHKLVEQGFDRAFIALHGRGGEDGTIQGALEFLGIPYTGSGVLGSALAMDKSRSKQIFKALGLPTASFNVVDKQDFSEAKSNAILAGLGGKVMVKPAHEGSSIGMAIAASSVELNSALNNAFKFDNQVLVEAWIDGPEYTVAILGDRALPAIHMETPNSFYDYQAKYQSTTTQYHCPCGLAPELEQELQEIALKAFKAVDAKGWGRVDVMRNNSGQWQILEVNTVPGMTETSLVPKAAKVAGLSFEKLVTAILEESMEAAN